MTDLHLDDRRALLLIKIIYNVRPADDGTRISQLNYPSLKEGDSCFTDNRLEHEFLGLTPSPRASHPVVPTVGRFLFRQIQYIMIFFKRQYFFSRQRAWPHILSLKEEVLGPHWITYFLEKISHLTYIMMLKENRKEFKYLQFDRLLKLSNVAVRPLPSGRGYDATPFGENKKSIAFGAIS